MNSVIKEATARQIVHRAMSIIDHSVNVMDEHGTIIASGDPHRLHQRHEGAVLALTENRVIEIDAAAARQLRGVRPGINLPVLFHNQIVGVVGISGEPDQVRAYAELVRMAAELILEQSALLEKSQWEKRYREEIALQLIAPSRDNAELSAMAAWLNLDLSRPRIAVILQLNTQQHDNLRQLMELFASHSSDALVTLHGFNQLVVLVPIVLSAGSDEGHQALKKWLRQQQHLMGRQQVARIYTGGLFSGPDAVHRSWLSAQAVQAASQRLGFDQRIVHYHEHSLPALLNDFTATWQAAELSRGWEKLLEADPRGILTQTLKAYFTENCDLSQTAGRLHIHVNTLRYRLNKTEQITGLKINELTSSLQLYIGMLMHS
ncbi:hypothetical protein TUM12370_30900 [Salmonella enterica subsp. enterica serovar Choleraesuis]|nr:hypothetical protein TUM12370_30900 [Salmonella enterica subsp. enterica serovar Choleraesuis]